MTKEAKINPYADHCTVRVRAYLRADQRLGRIDGPATEGQNGYREMRMRPDSHGEFTLIGVYDVTGSFIPYFPYDLNGQEGVNQWLNWLKNQGFKVEKLQVQV